MGVKDVLAEADDFVRSMGGTKFRPTGSGYSFSTLFLDDQPILQVDMHLRPKNSGLGMDRIYGNRLPKDEQAWFEANTHPYQERAIKSAKPRLWTITGTGGNYAYSLVLTTEVIDLMRIWLPYELDWQRRLATMRA